MKPTSILGAALLSSALLLSFASTAKATTYPDLTYNVTLNLSSLSIEPNSPFALDFQLVQGSGNVANTVTLSSFVFTGGTDTGTLFTSGGISGSTSSSLVLSSTVGGSMTNEIADGFSAGVTQITFHVDQTPNADLVGSGTAIPDQFNVAILDSNLNNLPTTDPSGGATLVNSDLAPETTVNHYTLAVPEPSSTALSVVVALGMLALVLRRRHQA